MEEVALACFYALLCSPFLFLSRYPHGKLEFFLVEALVLVGLLLC